MTALSLFDSLQKHDRKSAMSLAGKAVCTYINDDINSALADCDIDVDAAILDNQNFVRFHESHNPGSEDGFFLSTVNIPEKLADIISWHGEEGVAEFWDSLSDFTTGFLKSELGLTRYNILEYMRKNESLTEISDELAEYLSNRLGEICCLKNQSFGATQLDSGIIEGHFGFTLDGYDFEYAFRFNGTDRDYCVQAAASIMAIDINAEISKYGLDTKTGQLLADVLDKLAINILERGEVDLDNALPPRQNDDLNPNP